MPLLRPKCLILDHDDTVVNSTALLHWPAYQEALRILRPGMAAISLEEYFAVNCDPGIFRFYTDVIGLSDAEVREEYRIWLDYIHDHIPTVFPGMREVIEAQRARGGLVCVVTHSEPEIVLRDWHGNGLPEPDMIFGGSVPEEHRKPSPWPVQQIMARYGLTPDEVTVVDDLVPGFRMAQAAGVPFIGACWAHHIPQAEGVFRAEGAPCCTSPDALYRMLFSEGGCAE